MEHLPVLTLLALVCIFPLWAQDADEKDLLKLENDWSGAWVKSDAKFLDQLCCLETSLQAAPTGHNPCHRQWVSTAY